MLPHGDRTFRRHTTPAQSDLLARLPVQWGEFPLRCDTPRTIRIGEALPAPAIVVVQGPGMPLTPAAEFLGDVLRRHGPAPGVPRT